MPHVQTFNRNNRYNIEAMAEFLPVDTFFSHVYLVDLSTSLCEVARQRFERLGWKNVSVICQDARSFNLPANNPAKSSKGADMVTMSYSLSMIPGQHPLHTRIKFGSLLIHCVDYYSVVDSLASLLASSGILGVCDFYGNRRPYPW